MPGRNSRTHTEKGRVLVTTLTKRLAEELTKFLMDLNVKAKYLHSDIDTIERMQIIRDLRGGVFDVLVGINLLREGLDIPEVSLVAILDADKEGFLRSETSLIQTCGRAARNVEGRVIMYADKITKAIKSTVDITEKRRILQQEYNEKHGITPKTVKREIAALVEAEPEEAAYETPKGKKTLMVAEEHHEIPHLGRDRKQNKKLRCRNEKSSPGAALRRCCPFQGPDAPLPTNGNQLRVVC